MNETAIVSTKSKKSVKKMFASVAAVFTGLYMTIFSAFAFGESVTITATSNVNANDLMGQIIGTILTITRFVGIALVIYGVYEIVMSFMQNQPEAKTKGIIMALAGVVMIALKSVLQSLGLVG